MCIAADSGIDHARALGRVPDVVVGDFDSVSDEGMAWAEANGAVVEQYPAAKAETDLEIALARAVQADPSRVVVAAIGGGRFDHLLANFMLLANDRFASLEIDALVDTALVSVIHDRRELHGEIDELVSLLPVNGDVEGVTTSGLGYPLNDEPLPSGTSRGVSNYFVAEVGAVAVRAGTVLAIQPERLMRTTDGEHTPDHAC